MEKEKCNYCGISGSKLVDIMIGQFEKTMTLLQGEQHLAGRRMDVINSIPKSFADVLRIIIMVEQKGE